MALSRVVFGCTVEAGEPSASWCLQTRALWEQVSARVRAYDGGWDELPEEVRKAIDRREVTVAGFRFLATPLFCEHAEPVEDDDGNTVMVMVLGQRLVRPVDLSEPEYTIELSEPLPWTIDLALSGVVHI